MLYSYGVGQRTVGWRRNDLSFAAVDSYSNLGLRVFWGVRVPQCNGSACRHHGIVMLSAKYARRADVILDFYHNITFGDKRLYHFVFVLIPANYWPCVGRQSEVPA